MKQKSGGGGYHFPAVVFIGGLLVGLLGIVLAIAAFTDWHFVGAGVALLASATAFGLLSIAVMRS